LTAAVLSFRCTLESLDTCCCKYCAAKWIGTRCLRLQRANRTSYRDYNSTPYIHHRLRKVMKVARRARFGILLMYPKLQTQQVGICATWKEMCSVDDSLAGREIQRYSQSVSPAAPWGTRLRCDLITDCGTSRIQVSQSGTLVHLNKDHVLVLCCWVDFRCAEID
jgi:hypothetical protein